MSQANVIEFRRPEPEPDDTPEVGVDRLKQYFRDGEEAAQEPRRLAFRDRDYYDNYDNDQWTTYEKAKLRDRNQQIVVSNQIKRKVDTLLGYESRATTDPKAYPRRPDMAEAADIATDVLDYIEQNCRLDTTASEAAFDLAWSGVEACEVTYNQQTDDFEVDLIPYERLFFDPRSLKKDFSDSRYMGYCEWMDLEDAKARYPDKDDILDSAYDGLGTYDDGYEDKPYGVYGERTRRRVRVVVLYHRRPDGVWLLSHFTGAGILWQGESPWPDEHGNACGIIAESLYINRDGKRFGRIRDWISTQDEINQRKARSLHLLSDRRTWGVDGWTPDENAAKENMARGDGHVSVTSPINQSWGLMDSTAEIAGNLELLQAAIADMELGGQYLPQSQGRVSDQSGRAILALQEAGLTQDANFFGAHRDWKLRIYRRLWFMAKKFWQAPRWVRVTGEDEAARFVALNQPSPDGMGVMNPLGAIDVDIVIDVGPESVTLQHEQFEQLTQIIPALAQLPLPLAVMLLEASQLRDKRRAVEALTQFSQMQAQAASAPDPASEARANKDNAQAEKTRVETARLFAEGAAGPEVRERS